MAKEEENLIGHLMLNSTLLGTCMYIAEFDFYNHRVQVMDSSGQFIREFGQEGEGKLNGPTALHIADKFVYMCLSDNDNRC